MKPLLLTLVLLQLALSVRAQNHTNVHFGAPEVGAALQPEYGIGPGFGLVDLTSYRTSHFANHERQLQGELSDGIMMPFSDVAQIAHVGFGAEFALRHAEMDKTTLSWFEKRNVSLSF